MPFDVNSIWTPMGMGLLALVTAIFAFQFVKVGLSDNTRKGLKAVFALSLVGFVVTSGWLGAVGTSNPGTGTGNATFSVVASANGTQAWVKFDQVNHVVTVQFVYNSTSLALTNYTANVDFSITRSDLSAADAVATATLNSVASVGNQSGTGTTYPIVAKNTDGTSKVNWTRAATGAVSNSQATILVPGGGSAVLTLNITANSDAASNMKLYDVASAYFSVAGQPWRVDFLESVRNT